MRRVRYASSGAAPIAPDVLRFFMGIGVPMHEVYGMTENTAVATGNRPGRVKLGTVGEAHPGVEVRVDEDDRRDPDPPCRACSPATGASPRRPPRSLDADGWLRTGDVGEWVDGTHLKITDRMKDIIITAGRQEHLAVRDRERAQGLAVRPGGHRGRRRPQVPRRPDRDRARHRRRVGAARSGSASAPTATSARSRRCSSWSPASSPTSTRQLAQVEQIKEFRLLPKELDHEDGELTATQKVKRSAIADPVLRHRRGHVRREQPMTELLEVDRPRAGHRLGLRAAGARVRDHLQVHRRDQLRPAGADAHRRRGDVATSAPPWAFVLFTGLAFFLSMGAAVAGRRPLVALVVERLAIRPMVGRPVFVVAIITLGIDIAIRVVVGGFIGVGARPIPNPWGLARIDVLGRAGPASGTWSRSSVLAVVVVGAVLVLPLHALRPGHAGDRLRPGGRADPGRQRRQRLRGVLGARRRARRHRRHAARHQRRGRPAAVDRGAGGAAGDHPRRSRLPRGCRHRRARRRRRAGARRPLPGRRTPRGWATTSPSCRRTC